MNSILPIRGVVQHYSWGRPGAVSLVAKLSGNSADVRPHAELWFGAHTKAPSQLIGSDLTLDRLINNDPAGILGARVADKFSGTLPFLFKVLSIGSALSIQAHPDSERAVVLRRLQPDNYPDASHKPEIAVAVSGLTFLAGFVAPGDLERTLSRLPELSQVLTGEKDNAIASRFSAIFSAGEKARSECAIQIRSRLIGSSEHTEADRWFLKLFDRYGPAGDPGLFCLYMLRLERLKPGEALFTGPNIVHAYLDGEIVECMANSDNVVRAGLTEKYCDVETLLAMVAGSAGAEPQRINSPPSVSAVSAYRTPAEEFLVQQINPSPRAIPEAAPGELELIVSIDGSGSLDFDGKSVVLSPGSAFFKTAKCGSYRLSLARGVCYRVIVPQG